MFSRVGQIMLYVNNQDAVRDFWTEKFGFVVVTEDSMGEMRWIELAPTKEAETSVILHNKELIAKMSPELHLGTPSLMFYADDLDQLHSSLSDKGVTVGDIITMPSGRVFNFADNEDNYFAVMEKKQQDGV